MLKYEIYKLPFIKNEKRGNRIEKFKNKKGEKT